MQLGDITEYGSLAPQQFQLNQDIQNFISDKELDTLTVGLIKEMQDEVDSIENSYTDLQFYKAESSPLFAHGTSLVRRGMINFNIGREILDDYIDYKILFIGKEIK